MSVVLACDLGSTSFRAALVDADGVFCAESVVPAPTAIDTAQNSEIDAAEWWNALQSASQYLANREPRLFGEVQAVAICGVTRSQVILGGRGQLLRPVMTWKDTRSQGTAERLCADFKGRHPELTNLNAYHPLARLAWLNENEPALLESSSCVLEPKDYLNFRLTGQCASDAISMARLLAASHSAYGFDLFSAAGLQSAILPDILDVCAPVGRITPKLPAPFDRIAGAPVYCCSNDTWTAVVGLGAQRAGCAYNISGTTEVLGVLSEAPIEATGLLTVDWRGLSQIGGPSLNGAETATWLLSLLKHDATRVGDGLEALLGGRRHVQPILFLPYLQGERVPYWDTNLRGAFIGLHREHTATDLAWAVLEGIAFLNRIVLERAEAALGSSVSEIRFGGGGAANAVWCQIKADICGRPVLVGASREPGTLGAAIVAWTALGRFSSLQQAQEQLVRVVARYEPNRTRSAAYSQMFELFRRSEAALMPVSHGLATLGRQNNALPLDA